MPTELQEALQVAATVSPLIQKQIDPMLLEYQRRYAPLVRAIPTTGWGSTQYYFNRRTQRPSGGFVADGGARGLANSTYEQANFYIRLLQTVGAVTGFAQAVTRDLIGDLRQAEIDGAMTSLIWDVETGICVGNDGATNGTAPNGQGSYYGQFSGLDYLVSQYTAGTGSLNFVNALDQAGAALQLRHLDLLIDQVEINAAMPVAEGTGWMFVMSPTAQSKIAQLLMPSGSNPGAQRFNDAVTVAPGLITPSYRSVPILKSSFLAARNQAMGTVTTATNASNGTLAAATYFYQVSAVIARYGEIAASAEVSQLTAGATSQVSLTFATPTGPDGAQPILYKVYRSTTTGTESLLGVVDAFDCSISAPVATTVIIDTGTMLTTNGVLGSANAGNLTCSTAYVSTNAGAKPIAANQENIYLVPRDKNFLVRPYTRDFSFLNLAPTTSAPDTLPFAIVTDTALALRAPKYAARVARVQVAL